MHLKCKRIALDGDIDLHRISKGLFRMKLFVRLGALPFIFLFGANFAPLQKGPKIYAEWSAR